MSRIHLFPPQGGGRVPEPPPAPLPESVCTLVVEVSSLRPGQVGGITATYKVQEEGTNEEEALRKCLLAVHEWKQKAYGGFSDEQQSSS